MCKIRMAYVWLVVGVLAACGTEPPASVPVTVMTRNLYLGADTDPILLAETPEAMVAAVEAAWQTVQATDFPARAVKLAEEIRDLGPDLVGLQEVTLYRVQSPGDAIQGGTVAATDTVLDFLPVLLAAMAALDLDYEVVAKVQNFDLEAPRANETNDDIRLTDFEVILARGDVTTANPGGANFAVFAPVPIPSGGTLNVKRSWVGVDATIGGQTIRFVSTHLEVEGPPDDLALVQLAQGGELIQLLGGETRPLVVVGDLNSRADGSGTATYANFLGQGYQDAWTLDPTKPGSGFTCCHADDLMNSIAAFDKRIDYVLVRNMDLSELTVQVVVTGTDPAQRTESGLWPSDHGGVAAMIPIPLTVTASRR